jgi:hypothetical protein
VTKPTITKRDKPNLGSGKTRLAKRPKKGEVAPVFDSLFGARPAQPTPDPLSTVVLTGDIEADALAEVDAYRSALYRAEQERLDQYRELVNDPEYWCVICFQNRKQKEEFLEKLQLLDLGDKYLDGLKVAERLGVEIEPINLPRPKTPKTPVLLRKVPIIKRGGEA